MGTGSALTIHRGGLWVAIVALVMELGALLVLLVPEQRSPTGASISSWYWPLANTLYFVGLIAAGAAILWAMLALVTSRMNARGRSISLTAFGLAVLAIVVNRLVPYQ